MGKCLSCYSEVSTNPKISLADSTPSTAGDGNPPQLQLLVYEYRYV